MCAITLSGYFCVVPLSQALLVQWAYLLTCGTIHLSSLIWFDCIPPASVSANSPQCDSVVWHKVMKTHKALILCQWLWSGALVDLYAHTRTEEKNGWGSCSHIIYNHTHMDIHTAADTHTSEPEACCSLNYPAVTSRWLMALSLMVSMISSYWLCNFFSGRVRMGWKTDLL